MVYIYIPIGSMYGVYIYANIWGINRYIDPMGYIYIWNYMDYKPRLSGMQIQVAVESPMFSNFLGLMQTPYFSTWNRTEWGLESGIQRLLLDMA